MFEFRKTLVTVEYPHLLYDLYIILAKQDCSPNTSVKEKAISGCGPKTTQMISCLKKNQ